MDSFVTRKRSHKDTELGPSAADSDDDSTDVKLALLASLYPPACDNGNILLEALLASGGSVEAAAGLLNGETLPSPSRKKLCLAASTGYQSSLASFRAFNATHSTRKSLTKKGRTLYLFSPDDIACHTPCSIIHNFLPQADANALLRELIAEAPTFGKETFRLFDNVVTSPHTMAFYVDNWDEAQKQKTEYLYNGSYIADVRKTLTEMQKVSAKVQHTVNLEIEKRIQTHYPEQKKLKYQSPDEWKPNTAFVNCYDGGKESVGYHSDQLTYLGPRAVIGSLSLGVAREFRVRKIVPRNTDYDLADVYARRMDEARADTEGQISIHLPHNSLLVMHAEMQEEWKHSIAPAQTIDPHPIAKNKRINITYRCYRESFHPEFTPKCRCGVPTVLRCVQKKQENRGRYIWMCHAGYNPSGNEGCTFFQWAEFDDDGEPPWAERRAASTNSV